jgi:hypothetical protein
MSAGEAITTSSTLEPVTVMVVLTCAAASTDTSGRLTWRQFSKARAVFAGVPSGFENEVVACEAAVAVLPAGSWRAP